MIDRDRAVQLVEEILAQVQRNHPDLGPLTVCAVEEHELVWLVHWDSDTWLRTRDPKHRIGGGGPYLVDREDGSIHTIHAVTAINDEWESDYRYRVKGLPRPTGPDLMAIEVGQILVQHGKIAAMHHLRRTAPRLTRAQAQTYVSAIQAGQAPPADLAALTAPEPTELDPVLQVRTITGPTPP
ncbi:YrhB domain-containing protein [Actinocorallia sp. B10E7]|uniref:YrhB domain-containing protein n=1 Tax=Actinocorallia sp. B10E7 TaxID=3153558 RepID=UPI00325D17D6